MSYEDEIWYTGRGIEDLQTYISLLANFHLHNQLGL